MIRKDTVVKSASTSALPLCWVDLVVFEKRLTSDDSKLVSGLGLGFGVW